MVRNSARGSAPTGEIPLMFNRIKKKTPDRLKQSKLRFLDKDKTYLFICPHSRQLLREKTHFKKLN